MRTEEIKKLTWDKADFKTSFIRLSAEDTKTDEKRAVPLSATPRETLEEIRKEETEKAYRSEDMFFPGKGRR